MVIYEHSYAAVTNASPPWDPQHFIQAVFHMRFTLPLPDGTVKEFQLKQIPDAQETLEKFTKMFTENADGFNDKDDMKTQETGLKEKKSCLHQDLEVNVLYLIVVLTTLIMDSKKYWCQAAIMLYEKKVSIIGSSVSAWIRQLGKQ